jgi:hypothetical protein
LVQKVQALNVDEDIWIAKILDGTPEAQQLVLVNQADIKPWLFEG